MSREYTNKLLEKIEDGIFSYEIILKEMLCFFSEDNIKDFCLTSFGNEGILTDEEQEAISQEANK